MKAEDLHSEQLPPVLLAEYFLQFSLTRLFYPTCMKRAVGSRALSSSSFATTFNHSCFQLEVTC